MENFFREEIFPYLQPVPITKDKVISFLRDNRLYLAVRLYLKETSYSSPSHTPHYFVIKLPYSKVPRFIEPPQNGKFYLICIEDIIKANLPIMFPGYEVDSSYCIKISRDADILIDDTSQTDIVEQVRKKVKKRKTGAVSRFVYDRSMPTDFLRFLMEVFGIKDMELSPDNPHLHLEDLRLLPNPNHTPEQTGKPQPMKLRCLNSQDSVFDYIQRKDLLLHYPYHSFEHFIHFLYEAVHDPMTTEIMVTQYRVAENSEVIHTLIAAAQNRKKVTVCVELKARFDEEHSLATAQMMEKAGIHIIYSIPGLKVHAKVALILRKGKKEDPVKSFAYISTGNFNEKTATLYADSGLFTSNEEIVKDVSHLFRAIREKRNRNSTTCSWLRSI